MRQGTLPLAEHSRMAELGALIRAEMAKVSSFEKGGGVPLVQELPAETTSVTHRWVFEADTPKLSRGEGPVWRVTNINDALDIPTGRRRAPGV